MTEEKQETVGQYLRKEREKRNVSLDAVAKVTRITRENLEALENDDFQVISAPVFVRGFLRSYANFLGLDPKEVIAHYDSQTDLLPVPQDKEPPPPPPREENPIFKILLFLCIILVGVAFSFYYYKKTSSPISHPPPSEGVVPAPAPGIQTSNLTPPTEGKGATRAIPPEKGNKSPEKLPAATPPLADIDQTKGKRQVLRAVATEKTWLRIIADDQQVSDVLLQPRETSTWTARQKFAITIGNAGGVELFFNGASLGRLGDSGAVLHFVLPKEMQPTLPTGGLAVQRPPPPKDFKPVPPVSSLPSSKEGPLKENRPSPGDVSGKSEPSPETPSKETKPPESVPAPENKPSGGD